MKSIEDKVKGIRNWVVLKVVGIISGTRKIEVKKGTIQEAIADYKEEKEEGIKVLGITRRILQDH